MVRRAQALSAGVRANAHGSNAKVDGLAGVGAILESVRAHAVKVGVGVQRIDRPCRQHVAQGLLLGLAIPVSKDNVVLARAHRPLDQRLAQERVEGGVIGRKVAIDDQHWSLSRPMGLDRHDATRVGSRQGAVHQLHGPVRNNGHAAARLALLIEVQLAR